MIREFVEEICIKKNVPLDIEKIIYEYARLNLKDMNPTARIIRDCITSYNLYTVSRHTFCDPFYHTLRVKYLQGFKSWVLERIVFVNNHNRMKVKLNGHYDYISI